MTSTLADALKQEHVDIDAGIDAFTKGVDAGNPPVDAMLATLAAQRRHIYLEETILFPPLRAGGMFAAILVMLREHGRMWQLMDELEPLVRAGATDPRAAQLCGELVTLIEAHNSKEEPTIYAKADSALNAPATAELREFLANGAMPEGWVCEKA